MRAWAGPRRTARVSVPKKSKSAARGRGGVAYIADLFRGERAWTKRRADSSRTATASPRIGHPKVAKRPHGVHMAPSLHAPLSRPTDGRRPGRRHDRRFVVGAVDRVR